MEEKFTNPKSEAEVGFLFRPLRRRDELGEAAVFLGSVPRRLRFLDGGPTEEEVFARMDSFRGVTTRLPLAV